MTSPLSQARAALGLLAAFCGHAMAAESASAPPAPKAFAPPTEIAMPDGEFGKIVRQGEQVFLRRLASLREGVAAQGRNRGRDLQQPTAAKAHTTSILLSAVQLCLLSSVQVNLSVPDSSTFRKKAM